MRELLESYFANYNDSVLPVLIYDAIDIFEEIGLSDYEMAYTDLILTADNSQLENTNAELYNLTLSNIKTVLSSFGVELIDDVRLSDAVEIMRLTTQIETSELQEDILNITENEEDTVSAFASILSLLGNGDAVEPIVIQNNVKPTLESFDGEENKLEKISINNTGIDSDHGLSSSDAGNCHDTTISGNSENASQLPGVHGESDKELEGVDITSMIAAEEFEERQRIIRKQATPEPIGSIVGGGPEYYLPYIASVSKSLIKTISALAFSFTNTLNHNGLDKQFVKETYAKLVNYLTATDYLNNSLLYTSVNDGFIYGLSMPDYWELILTEMHDGEENSWLDIAANDIAYASFIAKELFSIWILSGCVGDVQTHASKCLNEVTTDLTVIGNVMSALYKESKLWTNLNAGVKNVSIGSNV